MNRLIIAVSLLLALGGTLYAQDSFDHTRLYGGGSAGSGSDPNSKEGQSAWQLYGGYQWFYPKDQLGIAVEAGYLASPGLGWKSSWVSPLVSYHVAPGIEVLARGGADFGGNFGRMIGIGASYAVERNMEVRLEYQQRRHLNTTFLTLVWRPWFFRDYADSY